MTRTEFQAAIAEKASEFESIMIDQGRDADAELVRGIPAAAEALADSQTVTGPDAVFGQLLRQAQSAAFAARRAARK